MLKISLIAFFCSTVASFAQTAPKPGEAPRGRYQIVVSPHAARDTFLLDTETGRVWQMLQFSYLDGEPSAWKIIPRIDNDDELRAFKKEWGYKPTPKTK